MYSVVILAGGSGTRMGDDIDKMLLNIHNKPVIEYSLDFFLVDDNCKEIIVVCSKSNKEYIQNNYPYVKTTLGGVTRQESVFNGLTLVAQPYCLIHDGARPYIDKSTIDIMISELVESKSVTLGVQTKDTIYIVKENRLDKLLNRSELVSIQTPQGFETNIIKEAHKLARTNNFEGTDDTSLVKGMLNIETVVIEGSYNNIKLTTKEDIKLLEVILS